MRELAIIIPMYNEEANAERCVREVCSVLCEHQPGTELFVVNDGSSDRTAEILGQLSNERLPFRWLNYSPNRGYGGALVAGMKAAHQAGFVYGLVMDSDLTNDPALIPQFAAKLSSGTYDVVKASRYIPGGGMEGVPVYRQMYTIIGNRIAAALFRMGIRDCTNGFHAVRLALISDVQFVERGFPFLLEELYVLKCRRARATEIPYILKSRAADEGESKFTYRPAVLWAYLKYALRAAIVWQ
ncbi:MAG: glycosyltransferase [Bdellovibrionota bacterium]